MAKRRHLLVLMPHTGECFSCSGVVAKHTVHGDRATFVTVCSGARLGESWDRHVERCRAAARILGAEFEAMDFPSSGALEVNWETKVKMAELLRRHRPDILITMPRESLYEQPHSDHESTHLLVYHARDLAARDIALPSGSAPHFVNDVYFLSDGQPGDVFIDVTDVSDLAQRAWKEIGYDDLLGSVHGALPAGISLKRSVNYRHRVRKGIAVEAYRPCYYEEKVLPLFPD
ncbi:MAG: PIG-L family deacetylase [Planctomycetota bacterium]